MEKKDYRQAVQWLIYAIVCIFACFYILKRSCNIFASRTEVFQGFILLILFALYGMVALEKKINLLGKIFIVGCITIIANVVILDLFANINTKVKINSYNESSETVEVPAGERKNFEFNNICPVDDIRIFFEGDKDFDFYVSISDGDAGQIIIDKVVDDQTEIEELNSERYTIALNHPERLKKGRYIISLENRSKLPMRICTNGEALNIEATNYTNIGYYIAFLLILLLLIYAGVLHFYLKKHNKISIEAFFIISVILLGLCYFILFTPWNNNDSNAHFLASYRLSNIILGFPKEQYWYGRVEDAEFFRELWATDWFSASSNPGMLSYTQLAYNYKLFCENTMIQDFPAHAGYMEYYSLLSYWPQVLGLVVGRLAGFSAITCAYLARLMIFTFYVIGCFNAVRNTPVGKGIFALVSLLPMSLMNSSGISYDPLVMITTLNFTACIFALYKNPSSKIMFLQTILWIFLVGATKGGGYLLLLPLAFLIIDRSRLKYGIIKCIGIIGTGLFSALLFDKWLQNGKEFFQLGYDSSELLKADYALKAPLGYIKMCIVTYVEQANTLLYEMVGSNLGWHVETTIPAYILSGLVIMIVLYSIFEEDKLKLDKKFKVVFWSIISLIMFVMPAMLLKDTSKYSATIGGLQGRYYLPILVLAFMLTTKFTFHIQNLYFGTTNDKQISIKNKCLYMFCVISCLSVYYMMRLYLRR